MFISQEWFVVDCDSNDAEMLLHKAQDINAKFESNIGVFDHDARLHTTAAAIRLRGEHTAGLSSS